MGSLCQFVSIVNSEIDDLHLVSVRPLKRLGIKTGYIAGIGLCDQEYIKNPAKTLGGSLVPKCSFIYLVN